MTLRQQNKARNRANIIAAAEHLITEIGVVRTTTRSIAKRAGISYQTLYNYFPTKSHVVRALMTAELNAWGEAVDTVIKNYTDNLLETLDRVNRIGLDYLTGDKKDLWLATATPVTHARYYALLSMAQGMGHLRQEVDLHLMAHTLFCLSDYALPGESDQHPDMVLQTLREQLGLVITPYLA